MDIDRVRNNTQSSRHFHFIFFSKILSYNFVLITTKLPAFGVNYKKKKRDRNLKITVIHLNIYLRTKKKVS